MQPADVDILVVPREQFGRTAESLESIYANTHIPFSLTYVDGNSPPHVRRYLERRSKELGFTLVRIDRYLPANQARNIGLAYCHAKYVAFLDNDVYVLDGWLERLLSCAQRTGAGIVGPLYYLGDPRERRIHTAGAELCIKQDGATRTFYERHRFVNENAAMVQDRLQAGPVGLVEFHCMLARRDIVDAVGLDEHLLSFLDHDDFCLRAAQSGAAIYAEPEAIVSHLSPPPIARSDLPFFILRWSNAWIDRSVAHFADKHGLRADDDGLRGHYRYRDGHRLRLIGRMRRGVEAVFGSRACSMLDRVVNRVVFDRLLEPAAQGLR